MTLTPYVMTLSQPISSEEETLEVEILDDNKDKTARAKEAVSKDINTQRIISNAAHGTCKACADFDLFRPAYTYFQKKLSGKENFTVPEISFQHNFKDLFEALEEDLRETTGETDISLYLTKFYKKTIELITSEILKIKGQKLAKLMQLEPEQGTTDTIKKILNTDIDTIYKLLKNAHREVYSHSEDLGQANLKMENFINEYFSEADAKYFLEEFKATIFRPKRRKQSVVIEKLPPHRGQKPIEGFIAHVPNQPKTERTTNRISPKVAGTAAAVSLAILTLLGYNLTNNSNADIAPKAPATKANKVNTPTHSIQQIQATVDKASSEISDAITYAAPKITQATTTEVTPELIVEEQTSKTTTPITTEIQKEAKNTKLPISFKVTNAGVIKSFYETFDITPVEKGAILRSELNLQGDPGKNGYDNLWTRVAIQNNLNSINDFKIGQEIKLDPLTQQILKAHKDGNLKLQTEMTQSEIAKKQAEIKAKQHANNFNENWDFDIQERLTEIEQEQTVTINSLDDGWDKVELDELLANVETNSSIDEGWNFDVQKRLTEIEQEQTVTINSLDNGWDKVELDELLANT